MYVRLRTQNIFKRFVKRKKYKLIVMKIGLSRNSSINNVKMFDLGQNIFFFNLTSLIFRG